MGTITIFSSQTRAGIQLAKEVESLGIEAGYKVFIVEHPTQEIFLIACLRDDIVVVDASIENGQGTVYPILTENPKSLDHVLVVSRTYLPINFYGLREGGAPPYPHPYGLPPGKPDDFSWANQEILTWLNEQIKDIQTNRKYGRLPINSASELTERMDDFYTMMEKSLKQSRIRRRQEGQLFLSYRSRHYKGAKALAEQIQSGQFPEFANRTIKMFSPGELTFENEVLSQMRRWSVLSLLDDSLRDSSDILIYRTNDYFDSWWTIGELICAAYIRQGQNADNHSSALHVHIYDPLTHQVLKQDERLDVQLSETQIQRLSRIFSNCRPDTMGPESPFRSGQMKTIVGLGLDEEFIELVSELFDNPDFNQWVELMLPPSMDSEEKEKAINYFKELYTKPDEFGTYLNDEVFSDSFWKIPSVQLSAHNFLLDAKGIDVENFLVSPKQDELPFTIEELAEVEEKGVPITLLHHSKQRKFLVKSLPPRYVWKPVRMGIDTGREAAALETLATYTISEYNPEGQI